MIEVKQVISMFMMIIGIVIIFTEIISANTMTNTILVLILGSLWLIGGLTYGDKEKW